MSAGTGIQFEVCRPLEADARQVMEWRNDPTTLSMSYHHEPKIWSTFWPEYCGAYLEVEHRLSPVFAIVNGKRVAFLRFKNVAHPRGHDGFTVDISINLAPEERGKGLGSRIIKAALALLRSRGVDQVYAEVVAHNVASIRAFESAGFLPLGPAQKLIPDTGETHSIVCFLAHAR